MEGSEVSTFLTMITCFLRIAQGENAAISRIENCSQNGVIHYSREQWQAVNCTICNCTAGDIECIRTNYRIDYGLFEINGTETCRSATCNVSSFLSQEATDECKAFSKALLSTTGLFTCSNGRSFIKNDHRCNGYKECPDGSDETGCEKRICKDENGHPIIEKTWKPSQCVTCSCSAGTVNCTKELAIFMAAMANGSFAHTINCRQPECKLRVFLRDANICEAYEIVEGSSVIFPGEKWIYKGCTFVFDNALDKPRHHRHNLAAPVCYLRRGAIRCDESCPVLSELRNRLRWSAAVKICINNFLLAHRCERNSSNWLYSLPLFRKLTRATSCLDENSASHFEGTMWKTDQCTTCECRNTSIRCTRTISQIDRWYSSTRDAIVQQCQQPDCNVTLFTSNARGICKGCKWKHHVIGEGTHWKESGIDFHCMAHERALSGCYVYRKGVDCTGAFIGLRNLSLISNGKMFICGSGDELRNMGDRCNLQYDCSDQSDEMGCSYVCPEQIYLGLTWKSISSGSTTWQSCSAINGTLTGNITVQCSNPFWTRLKLKTTNCSCSYERLFGYFKRKLMSVSTNNTSAMTAIAKELVDSYVNFVNDNNYYHLVSILARHRMSQPYPDTELEDNNTVEFFEKIHKCLEKLDKRQFHTTSLCKLEEQNYPSSDDPNLKIAKEIYRFREKSPNHTSTYSLRKELKPIFEIGALTARTFRPEKIIIIPDSTIVIKELPKRIWIPEKMNNSFEKIHLPGERNASTTNNCSKMLKKMTSKSNTKKLSAMDTVELVLVSLSTAVIIASLIILSLPRVKRSEKNFLHKNLLLSFGLAYFTYILDTTALGSRREFPVFCSVWAVIRYYLNTAVFTWMLAEGVKLCIVLVKVFPTKKRYVMYLLIGWGLPAVILAIVAAIKPEAFVMKTTTTEEIVCAARIIKSYYPSSCWLRANSWYYKGPVAAILTVNFVVFVLALRIIFGTISNKYSNDKVTQAKKGVKGVAALLPLLGVTWIFGFTIDLHESLAYIFILLSSTQGIVFGVVHCALDDEVRASLRALFGGSKSSSFKETTHTSTAPLRPQHDHPLDIATAHGKDAEPKL